MASPTSSAEFSLLSKLESLLSSSGHGPDDDDEIRTLFFDHLLCSGQRRNSLNLEASRIDSKWMKIAEASKQE
ncbi:hypothetical protein CRG98_048360 [Punica granatum]|uniref:Uncharacterized protein n=1 Tax=Punica granatum TaxID=22663 RepID=A0A2I0HHS6_PUNGR|nr:hypothetical protein CRG98_048360 [Punica granatum]